MILLKFEPEIKGDSTVEKHVGWIGVDSAQWGVGRSVSTTGGGNDRDTSNPSFSEVSISKMMDMASAQLFLEAAGGKSMTKATLHWLQTGGKEADGQHYVEITLNKPIISSYSMNSGGERPSESFSISFDEFKIQYDQMDEGGTKKAGKPKGWDLKTNKAKA